MRSGQRAPDIGAGGSGCGAGVADLNLDAGCFQGRLRGRIDPVDDHDADVKVLPEPAEPEGTKGWAYSGNRRTCHGQRDST